MELNYYTELNPTNTYAGINEFHDNKQFSFFFIKKKSCNHCKEYSNLNIAMSSIHSIEKATIVYHCDICQNDTFCEYVFKGESNIEKDIFGKSIVKMYLEISSVFPANREHFNYSIDLANISPNSVEILNDSYFAFELNLDSIAGVGLRKGLEFLIKDYAIHHNNSQKDLIENMQLMNCIKTFFSGSQIEDAAKAAVWLGNDWTHYIKRHPEMNIQDMISFIELVLRLIERELSDEKLKSDIALFLSK